MALMLDHQRRESRHQAEAPGPVPVLSPADVEKALAELAEESA